MNSIISDIALDLGPFALDLEFEGGKSNDSRVRNVGRDRAKMRIPPRLGTFKPNNRLTRCTRPYSAKRFDQHAH